MRNNSSAKRILALILALFTLLPLVCSCNNGKPDTSVDTNGSLPDGMVGYTVAVRTEGGMKMQGITVMLADRSGKQVFDGTTDENGEVFAALEKGEYTVTVSGLGKGFSAVTESVKTSADGGRTEFLLSTSVILEADPSPTSAYKIGDVLYDFSFVKDGKDIKLSEILSTKKLVVLNFWSSTCGPCLEELPYVQQAYADYEDSVEIIAMTILDDIDYCESFKSQGNYTFNLLPEFGLYYKFAPFGGGRIPFTIFIDRYGVFVNYVVGGDPNADSWRTEFKGYTSDGYVQKPGSPISDEQGGSGNNEGPKPTVSMPASAEIEKSFCASGISATFTPPASDSIWPWVLPESGKGVVPSNIGVDNTVAMLSCEVELKKGYALAFDLSCNIEENIYANDDYDTFAVYVGNKCVKRYSGRHENETCFVYTPESDGKYSVTFYFGKDSSDSNLNGNEQLVISNLRLVSLDDMKSSGGSLLVYRNAAWDVNEGGKPTSYKNYATVKYNTSDGFYHVGTADGPILLCDLMGVTAWGTSINDLAYDATHKYLTIGGVDYSERISAYTWQQDQSVLGYCPVDKTLADMLDLVVSSVGEGANHDSEWLEICGYFENYGNSEKIDKASQVLGKGLSTHSAFTASEGKNHVVVNRVLVPRGVMFEFIPKKDGVYKFYSVDNGPGEDDKIDTFGWLYEYDGSMRGKLLDESDDTDTENFNFSIIHSCKAGEKYYIATAFNAPDVLGEYDFIIEYFAESADILTPCTLDYYTTTLDGSEVVILRDRGLKEVLGDDGYYHRSISNGVGGKPAADMSDKGYIYVAFSERSVFMDYFGCTLKYYIENHGENFGQYEADMKKYLAEALDPANPVPGFVKADEKLIKILEETVIKVMGEENNGRPVKDQFLMMCYYFRHY